MKYVLSAAVVVVTGLALSSTVAAQDPIKSNPDVYHLVFENESVRVLRVTVRAGAKTTMHEHPDNVIVSLSNATVKFTSADGTVADAGLQPNQAMWSPAGKHSGENIGPPVEVLLVELKGAKAPTGTVSTAAS